MDTIIFQIKWGGGEDADIAYVLDNGQAMTAMTVKNEPGSVTCAYSTSHAPAHMIKWSLLFPGHKLKDLVATASVNGRAASTVDEAEEKEDRWASKGVV